MITHIEAFALKLKMLVRFRIGLGLGIAAHHIQNLFEFRVLFAAEGIVPFAKMNAAFESLGFNPSLLPSLHLRFAQDGQDPVVLSLLALTIFFALSLAAGRATQLSLVLLIYLQCSLNVAYSVFIHQADVTIVLVLGFALVVLPRKKPNLSGGKDHRASLWIMPWSTTWGITRGMSFFTALFVVLMSWSSLLIWQVGGPFDVAPSIKMLLSRSDLSTPFGQVVGSLWPASRFLDWTFWLAGLAAPVGLLFSGRRLRLVICSLMIGFSAIQAFIFHFEIQSLLIGALWLGMWPVDQDSKIIETEFYERLHPGKWNEISRSLVLLILCIGLVLGIFSKSLSQTMSWRDLPQMTSIRNWGVSFVPLHLFERIDKIGWILVSVKRISGSLLHYNFAQQKWSETLAEGEGQVRNEFELVPLSIYDEFFPSARWRNVNGVLMRSFRAQNIFWPQWKKTLCLAARIKAKENGELADSAIEIKAQLKIQDIGPDSIPRRVTSTSLFEYNCAN